MDEKERKELRALVAGIVGETVQKSMDSAHKIERRNGYVRRGECTETRKAVTDTLKKVVDTQEHHTGKLDKIGKGLENHVSMDAVRERERERADVRVANLAKVHSERGVADRIANITKWKAVAAWIAVIVTVLGAIVSATFFFARLQARAIAKQYAANNRVEQEAIHETSDR